ncbi:MAG: bifunctional hydroxymethylpyrimidine kinase/phosphomethylpyrimidine kinase [Brachymonas sp.]|nr:bifunctional hydroxymethylpyrimidine kinase/phosphomethylpyrimidine kinase [Brachymonas sp.]
MPVEPRLTYPRLLSIAGTDCSGGAGMQADLKTFAALGCYGMSAITAVIAQNTTGVQAITPVTPELLRAQIDSAVGDVGCDAAKIGLVPDVPSIRAVADALRAHRLQPVVLDPVVVATSGCTLMEHSAASVLLQELAPLCQLITPNLHEAQLLAEQEINDVPGMLAAARSLQKRGASAVLLKGGHLAGDALSDVLVLVDGSEHVFTDARIDTCNTHGTGCTLSAAIACYLALGCDMLQAVQRGRVYLRGALAAGANVRVGQGHGPVNHGFDPQPMQTRPWNEQA